MVHGSTATEGDGVRDNLKSGVFFDCRGAFFRAVEEIFGNRLLEKAESKVGIYKLIDPEEGR